MLIWFLSFKVSKYRWYAIELFFWNLTVTIFALSTLFQVGYIHLKGPPEYPRESFLFSQKCHQKIVGLSAILIRLKSEESRKQRKESKMQLCIGNCEQGSGKRLCRASEAARRPTATTRTEFSAALPVAQQTETTDSPPLLCDLRFLYLPLSSNTQWIDEKFISHLTGILLYWIHFTLSLRGIFTFLNGIKKRLFLYKKLLFFSEFDSVLRSDLQRIAMVVIFLDSVIELSFQWKLCLLYYYLHQFSCPSYFLCKHLLYNELLFTLFSDLLMVISTSSSKRSA